jgi:quinol-cytochrome oxidoreductase complex cytochrome b subunit
MFKGEVFQLISQVLTSWQVIAVSIALILFLNLVFYTARAYHSTRMKKVKVKKEKPEALPLPESEPEIIEEE